MKYSLATNWDEKLIPYIVEQNRLHKDRVVEVFGSLSYSIFGSARIEDLPKVNTKEVETFISKLKKTKIKLNYLFNTSVFPNLKNKENYTLAMDYLNWIKKINPDMITIANEKMLAFVNKHLPKQKVNLSIVMLIKSVTKAEKLFKKYKNIVRITLHPDLNRDLELLKKHIALARKYGVEVELYANGFCCFNCPKMKEHYAYVSKQSQIDGFNKVAKKGLQRLKSKDFSPWCGLKRKNNLVEILNSTWIMPEDVGLYEKQGVNIIKLAGRTEKTAFLKGLTKAFMLRKSPKNLMDITSKVYRKNYNVEFLESKGLRGFVSNLWKAGKKRLRLIPEGYKVKYKNYY
jgi:collagenase-like PrtC family protease